MQKTRIYFILILTLSILSPLLIIGYKINLLDYKISDLTPVVVYRIDEAMEVNGNGEDISITTYLPATDNRQTISEEENAAENFSFTIESDSLNRIATWKANNMEGHHFIRYSYSVEGKHLRYTIPPDLEIPESYPEPMEKYLEAEKGIQVHDPLIEKKLGELFPEKPKTLYHALFTIHRDLMDNFPNRKFAGYTDALTALKLGEASCNGKSRLFAALTRKLNIPSRLVGGVIMKRGVKRVSHQWLEVYVNGYWVPFDTINDHFAEIPGNYLTLYYGDLYLFKHTSDINFQYNFRGKRTLMAKQRGLSKMSATPFNILNLYGIFERVGISQNLLKIILMIPLGAFVIVVLRNVVGLETFGTFLPVLIAAASRDTGLLWGIIGFILIIFLSYLVGKGLEGLGLLHSPKMAIMLTTVVISMMTVTVVGVHFRLFQIAHITLFPIAVLAITAERFAIMEAEQGFLRASTIFFTTLLAVSACYLVMDSLFLQNLILAFPELLFAVIGLNLWIGKWIGIRTSEFVRFRRIIFGTTDGG